MTDETTPTPDALLAAWRQAEIDVNGTRQGTAEHDEALRRADEARQLYHEHLEAASEVVRARLENLKDKLGGGG